MEKEIIKVTEHEAQEAIQIVYDIGQYIVASGSYAAIIVLDVDTSKRIQECYKNFSEPMD